MIWIFRSFWPSSLLASVSDSYLILSRASEELLTDASKLEGQKDFKLAGICERLIPDLV